MTTDKGLNRIIENEFLQQRRVNMKRVRVNRFLNKYLSGQFQKDRKDEKKQRQEKRAILKEFKQKD